MRFLLRRQLRLQGRRQVIQRAQNHINWTLAFVHVGSGNMAFSGLPRAPSLLPVNLMMNKMWNELQNEKKLFDSIGLTPDEFWYMYNHFAHYRMAAGAIDNLAGRFRMTSFGRIWPEFYLLCDYLKNYSTRKKFERDYQLAKSSIAILLPHLIKVYLAMLSAMIMHPWPTVPEKIADIAKLHPILASENIFFISNFTN